LKTLLVTFSGTHGTGKSTHAGRCYYLLNQQGHRFAYVRHQDLLDPFGFVLRRAARILGYKAGDLERTEPVRVFWSLYLLFIYLPFLVGGIRLRRLLGYSVVVDRYLYDLLVGFWGNHMDAPLQNLLIWTVTHPDVSFVLDADEQRILRERPEHTAEFIRNEKRLYGKVATYFRLKNIHTTDSAAAVWKTILEDITSALSRLGSKST
jgi:thymidylate kinase